MELGRDCECKYCENVKEKELHGMNVAPDYFESTRKE